MSVTSAYQKSLTLALLSVSPSLAALHVSRNSIRDDASSSSSMASPTCSKCGNMLLPGRGNITVGPRTGKRKRPDRTVETNTVKKNCSVCGFEEDLEVQTGEGGKSSFEPARRIARRRAPAAQEPSKRASGMMTVDEPPVPAQVEQTASTPVANSTSSRSTPVPTVARSVPSGSPSIASPFPSPSIVPSSAGRSRKKKKTSLHDLLERNRQQQEQRKGAQGPAGGGLLGFLDSF